VVRGSTFFRVFGLSVFGFGGAAVKQDVVLVISEDVAVRRELADRLDWDDVPFELASTVAEAVEAIAQLPSGARCVVVLDFDRRARARVMDALRGREDLEPRLLLLHDAFEDGLSDARVVEHVRRPAVPDYLYSLVERHATRAVA
jgi:DNA-binding NtrC family response regulator